MFLEDNHSEKYQHWSDEQLIAAFRQSGEAEYFSALFTRYTHLVYLNCRNFFSEDEECRDAVMQTFAKVYQLISTNKIGSFPNWLYIITRNECLDLRRKASRSTENHEEWKDFTKREENFVENEAFRRLQYRSESEIFTKMEEALSGLDEEQRVCLQLFYYEKKSYREISDITSFSEKQVKSYLQNGKRKLKTELSSVRPKSE